MCRLMTCTQTDIVARHWEAGWQMIADWSETIFIGHIIHLIENAIRAQIIVAAMHD